MVKIHELKVKELKIIDPINHTSKVFKVTDLYKNRFNEDCDEERVYLKSMGLKRNLFIRLLFPNCDIEDCQYGYENGHPDYKIITEDGEELYIEYKTLNDHIRISQLEWIYKNKDKKFIFLKEQ